jgi:predicted flavoprotein YhiN
LKRLRVSFKDRSVMGEAIVTAGGLEGGAIYALAPALREALAREGRASLTLDLRPDLSAERIAEKLRAVPAGQSRANQLRKALGLPPVAIGLLREAGDLPREPDRLAGRIKALTLEVTGLADLARAISTAGGVSWDALDDNLMLRALPGVYIAGEMIDWEAPTGGYLLQACLATGAAVANAILKTA